MISPFGQRLRELRRERGLSQRDLAAQVQVDFTYISKIETGDTPSPSSDLIHRLAQVLATDEGELLALTNKREARYHRALSNLLALFVAYNGWDYATVDDALDVLEECMDRYPTRMALVERIEGRRTRT